MENGYIPISNEVMDRLCQTRIPGEAGQVLDATLRNLRMKQEERKINIYHRRQGLWRN
jgi:hypothetical protein